ncbi:hypothetical protein AB0H34_47745 [Saccharopolyspora shandongensis]|uniref:hypothetical protein n=1 Tax=Saccharopolyspora shandongensis TaxID=418495 RepID=UPI0034055BBA
MRVFEYGYLAGGAKLKEATGLGRGGRDGGTVAGVCESCCHVDADDALQTAYRGTRRRQVIGGAVGSGWEEGQTPVRVQRDEGIVGQRAGQFLGEPVNLAPFGETAPGSAAGGLG